MAVPQTTKAVMKKDRRMVIPPAIFTLSLAGFWNNRGRPDFDLGDFPITICGGGGIRTLDTLAGILVFETSAFNHSATPP